MRIDLAWMMRSGYAVPGSYRRGSLEWTCGGQPSGNISYLCDMRDPADSSIELRFTVTNRATGERRDYVQRVPLTFTVPNLGGKRWWMLCPVSGSRVGKLYCPRGGDIFASRRAWRLGYQSQRVTARDKPFERLFALQKKLGCPLGWDGGLYRPKGMWHRTFERHLRRYMELDAHCSKEAAGMLARLDSEFGDKRDRASSAMR